ncbi:M48 family metalloprotease [Candidatus Poribacteria bacterium]|nr:M48 family metalloprotease [Candidatus Poribacteria bacterium]
MAQTSIILLAGIIFLIRYEPPESGLEYTSVFSILYTIILTTIPILLAYLTRKLTEFRSTIVFEILSLLSYVSAIYIISFPNYIYQHLPFISIVQNSTEIILIIPLYFGILGIHAVMHDVSRTRKEYITFRFRLLLLPLMPFLIINVILDILSFFPTLVAGLLLIALIIPLLALPHIIAPMLMQFLWKTKPLRDTELKQKIMELTENSSIKYKDVAVWETGGLSIANAAVAGIIPRNRRIFVTDALLRNFTDEQVETIVAHEIGHIRHKHLLIFCVIMVCYILSYTLFIQLVTDPLESLLPGYQLLITVIHIIFFIFYFKVVLSFLSRRFEHQADLYAIEITGNPDAFKSALLNLSIMSDLPRVLRYIIELFNTHPSIERRIRFLENAEKMKPPIQRYRKCLLEVKVLIFLIPLMGLLIYLINL